MRSGTSLYFWGSPAITPRCSRSSRASFIRPTRGRQPLRGLTFIGTSILLPSLNIGAETRLSDAAMRATTLEFVKRTAIVVALAPLPLLAWYLRDFLLVFVGSLLVAMLLQLVSEPLVRWCRFSES